MSFVNRNNELNSIVEAINDNNQIIYLIYEPASGISAFLKKCMNVYADKHVFLLNAVEQSDFATGLCGEACKNKNLIKIMQNLANKKFGQKSQSFLSSLMKTVPYGGTMLSYFTERSIAAPVYMGAFHSVYEEIAFSIVDIMRKEKRVIFIVDNALNLSETSLDLCLMLSKYPNVYFIFALKNNETEVQKFENSFNNFFKPSNAKSIELMFCHPDTKMIQLLAEAYEINCSLEQAEDIAKISHDNIHTIITYMLNYKKSIKINQTQKLIINILNEFNFKISEQTLCDTIEQCSSIVVFDKNLIKTDIKKLINMRIAEESNDLIYLISKNHPKVADALNDLLLINSVKSAILETIYNGRLYTENNNFLNLAYKIAVDFHDNRCTEFSKIFLSNAVNTGVLIREDIISIYKNNMRSQKDYLILIVYLTQSRRYSEALDIINQNNLKSSLRSLYAVLLNRCRKHKQAEKELKKAINDENDIDRATILYAYLISNYVHDNKSEKAKYLFGSIPETSKNSLEYAYILRNYATTCSPLEAEQFSKTAEDKFVANKDTFGQFTANCNKNRFLCEQGHYQEALKNMMLILDNAVNYRNSDLHILLNNIAICHIYLKNAEAAEYYIKSALSLSKSDMPDIFIRINYSLLFLFNGNRQKALKEIECIKNKVLEFPVDRVRERYFINYCHILYANNKNYDDILEMAKKFKDRVQPDMTDKICMLYEDLMSCSKEYSEEDFFTFFIPCYLEYWYTEPLKLIPSDIVNNFLSIHTGGNDITY